MGFTDIIDKLKNIEPIDAQKFSAYIAALSAFLIFFMNAIGSYGYVIDGLIRNTPPEYAGILSIVVWIVFAVAIFIQWKSSTQITDENDMLKKQLTLERLDTEKALNKMLKMSKGPMGTYKIVEELERMAEKRKE